MSIAIDIFLIGINLLGCRYASLKDKKFYFFMLGVVFTFLCIDILKSLK